MINPIRQFSDINSKIHGAAAAMERIDEFLSWEPKIKELPNAIEVTRVANQIEFKNVSFAYPDAKDEM